MTYQFVPRAGAMRYEDGEGIMHCANPGDTFFSLVSMAAICSDNGQFWKEVDGVWQWVSINNSEDAE